MAYNFPNIFFFVCVCVCMCINNYDVGRRNTLTDSHDLTPAYSYSYTHSLSLSPPEPFPTYVLTQLRYS